MKQPQINLVKDVLGADAVLEQEELHAAFGGDISG